MSMSLAQAGTIGIKDGKLIVSAERGVDNQAIQAANSGKDLLSTGVTFDIVTPGCSGQAKVLCALSGFTGLIVLSGAGGNDSIFGDSGDDVLIGGPGHDCLSGEREVTY